jgi:hypothetical protein
MPKTDAELIKKLMDSTDEKRIEWRPTATLDQYAAAFGGKWTVILDKTQSSQGSDNFYLSLSDREGQELIRITDDEDPRIAILFEKARRRALKVDDAIEDVFKELDNLPG